MVNLQTDVLHTLPKLRPNTAPQRGIYDVQLTVDTRRVFEHFRSFEFFPFRR